MADASLDKTYCNPLVLPNYPRGRNSHNKATDPNFKHVTPRDYRETADPTVLYHEGKWYLYPSCGMAYVSEDFVTWQHHPTEPPDVGYAPTVAVFRDKFLLTALCAPMFQADNPLGPFEDIGPVVKPDGNFVDGYYDPMIFPDDDGRLYIYWGLGGPGIFVAELDPDKPTQLITEPKVLFKFNPDHVWERSGEHNEDRTGSCLEGAWMLKHDGRYYLTYCGPGTEWSSYAMGCYVGDSPMGTFHYQSRNPILSTRSGLVRGPGHGCIVRGPADTLWAFYTCTVCYEHMFERRIGMDPAGIDADGNLFVLGASEIPQWAPGVIESPENGNDIGLLPVSRVRIPRASSESPGRDGLYALDGSMLTWWQPESDDPKKTIDVRLANSFTVSAVRVVWRDVGLDYDSGVGPGPFQYKVEVAAEQDGDDWTTVVDCTTNETDLLIDYRTFEPCSARRARLVVTGAPAGIEPGLIDFTVFGTI